jgi:putative oxidoreductase
MKKKSYKSHQYGALILRIALGVMFIAHAQLKIFTFTMAGTAGYFESIGLPGFLNYPTVLFELLGGIALVIGFQTRLVSIGAIPLLLGTIIFAHWNAGWLFTNQGGGWEYPAFLMFASLAQIFLGDGAYAVKLKK